MSEEVTEGPESTEGQAIGGPDGDQTPAEAPGGSEGQPAVGTTEDGPQEPTFFDPKQLPPELMPGWKQLQASYTKKMQDLSANKQKIEAYDAFEADPVGQMQRYAQQYGYQLTRAEAAQQIQQQQDGNDWEPQSWNEVLSRAEDQAYQRIRQDLGPVLREVQAMKKNSIERELSEIDPTWHQYEDDMKRLMNIHPTLANDAALLYKMAVPEEVSQSRATQAALARLEAKGQAARVSGGSTTNKHPKEGLPDKPLTFNESVRAAKKKLAEEGITRLGAEE
jgi:hypothetical protein